MAYEWLFGRAKERSEIIFSFYALHECCLPLRFRLIFRISVWRLNFKNCRTFLNWIYDSIARNACRAEYQTSSWYEYSKYRENVSIIRCCHNTSTLNNKPVKVFSYSLIPSQRKEKGVLLRNLRFHFKSTYRSQETIREIGFHEVSAFSIYAIKKHTSIP